MCLSGSLKCRDRDCSGHYDLRGARDRLEKPRLKGCDGGRAHKSDENSGGLHCNQECFYKSLTEEDNNNKRISQ